MPRRRAAELSRNLLLVLFALAAMGTILGAIIAFQRFSADIRNDLGNGLQAEVDLKYQQIAVLLRERMAIALFIANREHVARALDQPADPQALRQVAADLSAGAPDPGERMVGVFDANGQPAVPGVAPADADTAAALRQSTALRRPVLTNFWPDPAGGAMFGVVVPVRRKADGMVLGSALFIVSDRGGGVHVLSRWPSLRQTLLLALVKDTGAGFAGRPLGISGAVLAPQNLLADGAEGNFTRQAIAAAGRPVRGFGPVRHVPVIGTAARILDTPWYLVASLEASELDAPIWRLAAALTVGAALLLGVLLLSALLMLRRQRIAAARQELAASQRYVAIIRDAREGFARIDAQGTILEINEALVAMFGLPRPQLLGSSFFALRAEGPPDQFMPAMRARLAAEGHATGRHRIRRGDGRIVFLDGTVSIAPDGRRDEYVAFIRDATADVEAQRRLERLNNLHRFLGHVHASIAAAGDARDLLRRVADGTTVDQHIALVWTGWVDRAAKRVVPLGTSGRATEYAWTLDITLDPALPTSQGPAGIAVREARTVVVQDVEANQGSAPWRAAALRHDLHASVCLPLFAAGEVVAALSFYSDEPQYFDEEVVALVRDMANALSMALDAIAQREAAARSAAALLRRESIHSSMLEQAFEGFALIEPETGAFVEFNTAAHAMLGYSRTEFATMRREDFLGRAPRPELMQALSELHRHVTFETRLRHRDGTWRDARFSAQALMIGGRVYHATMWTDSTEELQQSRALREAAEKHRILFEQAIDGIAISDADGYGIEVNDRLLSMLGLTRARAIGSHATDWCLAFDSPQSWKAGIDQVVGRGIIEQQLRRGDGSMIDVETAVSAADTGNGRIYFFTVRDVSARRTAERELARYRENLEELVQARTAELAAAHERLRISEERYVFASAATSDGIWDYDVASDVFQGNASLAAIFGYPLDEFPRRPADLRRLVHPEDLPRLGSIELERLTAPARMVELRVRGKDGAWRWILDRSMVVARTADGRPQRIVGTVTDLTTRKQAEEELRAAKLAAEAANRAKSTFLATMSHEIRTPLNGVIGLAEALGQEALEPRLAETAQLIHQSAIALLSLLDDILDFSKIEAGRLQLELMPAALEDVLDSAHAALLPAAAKAGVDLDIKLAPEMPARLLIDPVRLRQILLNLAGNAVKFSGGDPGRRGRVTISAWLEQVEPPLLCLTIADDGIGMSEATLAVLFEPFTQGESSTTRRFGGSGLGLSITQRLLDLMDGRIAVASAPGEGTTFTVCIPVAPAADAAVEKPLAGLHCYLGLPDPALAEQVAACLQAAGAATHCIDPGAAVAGQALPGPDAVVIAATPPADGVAAQSWLVLRREQQHFRASLAAKPGDPGIRLGWLKPSALSKAVLEAAGRAARSVPRLEPAAGAARSRILVAEDDEINRRVIARQLELLGYACDIVPDGAAALERWRHGGNDLVLTDLYMPELDGYQLADAIRHEEGEGMHTPILMLSANAEQEAALHAQASGIDAFLTKPARLAALKEALAAHLAG